MTLADFINKYNGVVVEDGQCGSLVRQFAIEVQGITPVSYTDAKDYWFNPVPGYVRVTDDVPQPGDWAIYNAHTGYPEGHMAVYYDGRVFEQNADPDGSPAHLFNRANTYLLGYLRLEGEDMQQDNPNAGDLVNIYDATGWPGHAPNANDIAYWCNGTGNPHYPKPNDVWTALTIEVNKFGTTQPATVLSPGIYKVS